MLNTSINDRVYDSVVPSFFPPTSMSQNVGNNCCFIYYIVSQRIYQILYYQYSREPANYVYQISYIMYSYTYNIDIHIYIMYVYFLRIEIQ